MSRIRGIIKELCYSSIKECSMPTNYIAIVFVVILIVLCFTERINKMFSFSIVAGDNQSYPTNYMDHNENFAD